MNADIIVSDADGEVASFFGAPTGQRIRVKRHTMVVVHLNDTDQPLTWATTHDPLLDVNERVDNLSALIIPTGVGTAKVLLLNQDDEPKTMFHLNFEVFDPSQAVTLDGKIGPETPDV
jgi:hypothetical protein